MVEHLDRHKLNVELILRQDEGHGHKRERTRGGGMVREEDRDRVEDRGCEGNKIDPRV